MIRLTFLRRSAEVPIPWILQALADAVADRRAWVEAGVRVLEDDLHPPPVRLQRGALDLGDVLAIEQDGARRRVDEAQEQPSDRGLAAARLADEAERFAATDLEADAVHGLDEADLPLEDPAVDREVLHEVLDLDQRRRGGRRGGAAVGWHRGLGGRHAPNPLSPRAGGGPIRSPCSPRGIRPPAAS